MRNQALASLLISGLCLLPSGCQRAVDQGDPLEMKAAAEVVMLSHVVPEKRAEILTIVEKSTLPPSVKIPALSGDASEEARAGRIILSQVGAAGPDVARRIDELSRLVNGVTERSMGTAEMLAIEPWIEARMHWAVVDGGVILGRGGEEVGMLTGGLNLSKSQGLTRHGADMVRGMVNPVLEQWKLSPVDGFAGDVRYIAALFGARESVEAAVVIFSVLAAIGLAGSGRLRAGRILAGVFLACLLAVGTGLVWNALIQVGSLAGGKQTIFIAFGVLSIVMFLLVGSAIFHPIYFGKWMSKLREVGRGNAGWAAFIVSFLAVYREGFEMSLSMTTLSMMGGWDAVLQGLGIGIPAGLLMIVAGWKVHRGWMGVRGMMIASGVMMVLAASSFSALFVNYLEQQGAIIPVYILKDTPVALTVFTGFSGSLQTLAAFTAVMSVLVIPWGARRLRNSLKNDPAIFQREIGQGWGEFVKVAGTIAVLAGIAAFSQQEAGGGLEEPVETVDWAYAKNASDSGRAVLVDARETGSTPAVEGAISLPMDNDDGSIKEFCDFVGEGKEILVLGAVSGGVDGGLANRISTLCARVAKNVTWEGAEP